MKYATYKKKPTKYQKKQRDIEKVVFISIVTAFMLANILYSVIINSKVEDVIVEVESIKQDMTIEDLEVIPVPVITNEPDIELQIRAIADEMDFKWSDYLVRLAYCESRLDPMATNRQGNNPSDSYDRGLFQFNSYWQKQVLDECAYDVRCSTETTIKMINDGKQHLWACDDIIKHK